VIDCILFDEINFCNVASLLGMSFISESSFQKCALRSSKKILCRFQSQKRQIPSFRPDGPYMCLDAHQCPEDSNSSRLHLSESLSNTSGRSSKFEKNPVFKVHPFERHGNTVWTPVSVRQVK
jgi:hypothetical protein